MAAGLKRDLCLGICGLTKNAFYYQVKSGKPGRKKTTKTFQLVDNQRVEKDNAEVIAAVKAILAVPNAEYGYRNMTNALQLEGWFINHKKVYRLLKSARLLRPKLVVKPKNYVKYRILAPEGPLRLLEQDIKQIWLEEQRRYAYVLTIIDVFTRFVLHRRVGLQMRQADVQKAWEAIIADWLQPLNVLAWEVRIEVRNDNGPQFRAMKLQDFLSQNALYQTFTHPYTPQENGHVESFHAILGNNLAGKLFRNITELTEDLDTFYPFYNYRRIHGSTCGLPPALFWQQWNKGNVERKLLGESKRKARFQLTVGRQYLQSFEPAGHVNPREVLSLIFEGSIPDKIRKVNADK